MTQANAYQTMTLQQNMQQILMATPSMTAKPPKPQPPNTKLLKTHKAPPPGAPTLLLTKMMSGLPLLPPYDPNPATNYNILTSLLSLLFPPTNPVTIPLQLKLSHWSLCTPTPYAPCLPIKTMPLYQNFIPAKPPFTHLSQKQMWHWTKDHLCPP